MACDIRLASAKAVFGQPEAGLGITPGFGGTQRLSKIVGPGNAAMLILRGQNRAGAEGSRAGRTDADSGSDGTEDRVQRAGRSHGLQDPSQQGLPFGSLQRLRTRSRGLWRMLRHRGPEGGHESVPE